MRINPLFFEPGPRKLQVLNFTPNGCGSLEGWYKYTYKLIPNFIYKKPCHSHDLDYYVGGYLVEHRERADARFKDSMEYRRTKGKYAFKWALKGFYKKIAKIYYHVVVEKGNRSFNMFKTQRDWVEHCVKNNCLIYNEKTSRWEQIATLN